MAFTDVKTLYRSVIDEVTTRSRPEFVQEGVDEAILDELRLLWEAKLEASGVLAPEPERVKPEPARPQHQMGAPGYRATVQTAPGANIGRPQTYMAPWQQRPVTGGAGPTVQTGQASTLPVWSQAQGFQQYQSQANGQQAAGNAQHQATAPSGSHQQQPQALSNGHPAQYGASYSQAPQQQYQGPAGVAQRPPYPGQGPAGASQGPSSQGPTAYAHTPGQSLPGQAQYAAQQQQGAPSGGAPGSYSGQAQAGASQHYSQQPQGQSHQNELHEASRKRKAQEMQEFYHLAKQQMLRMQQGGGPQEAAAPSQPRLPQQDGPSEASEKSEGEGDEEAEKEELENFSDVASSNDEDDDLPNQCISQFLKVQRTKNKWKCQLKGGIIHLKGRDHVFGLANGEFQF